MSNGTSLVIDPLLRGQPKKNVFPHLLQ